MLAANDLWSWVVIIALTTVTMVLVKLSLQFVSTQLRPITGRSRSRWGDIGVDLIDGLKTPVICIWLLNLFAKLLTPSAFFARVLLVAFVTVTVFQAMLWGQYIIRMLYQNFLKRRMLKIRHLQRHLDWLIGAFSRHLLL